VTGKYILLLHLVFCLPSDTNHLRTSLPVYNEEGEVIFFIEDLRLDDILSYVWEVIEAKHGHDSPPEFQFYYPGNNVSWTFSGLSCGPRDFLISSLYVVLSAEKF
jgi:hypothetical protein